MLSFLSCLSPAAPRGSPAGSNQTSAIGDLTNSFPISEVRLTPGVLTREIK
ncbi:hypothetical protein HCH_02513 [Hahella chejuensis KCTC 2396]|uniref:Uncharacterized protein n=1 Tax=Hahella chejuensis (strain KCTC 2396) TaxID=349521 RepID=Q2SJ59_HAHCH|nr:hypothetical protein HCH_02513 [Hahella chejuensis KCTC 2396]